MRRLAIIGAALALAAAAAADAPLYFAHEANGIGDPNPFYEDGVYSVFYLKNEGRHPWWMSRSRDLSDWSKPVEAVAVGGRGSPDHWTGSGSVIADPAGGYRLYYTGHAPDRRPREVTMEAHAPTLAGPWRKVPAATFAGPPHYDAMDFRDPYVFWNAQARAWWMLLTTRHAGKAAIGLYTSPDLSRWRAAPPLHTEASPLNLEVPDLFAEGDRWYLLYSDQREASRQVRHLIAETSAGPYRYPAHDALDGRAFYAGKSAGDGDRRRLFGWLAHRKGRRDAGRFDWGGDLVAHALTRRADGQLAVSLPEETAARFTVLRARLSPRATEIGSLARPLLLDADLRVRPGGDVRFDFLKGRTPVATLKLDTKREIARFSLSDDPDPVSVAFPENPHGRYRIKLVTNPQQGFGILYVNAHRALSFRLYAIGTTRLRLIAPGGFEELSGSVLGTP